MNRASAGDPLVGLGPLLDRLEALLDDVEALDDDVRGLVFELLDGVDAVHRLAIVRLAHAVDWLFEAYGVGVDDAEAASVVLDEVRPYLHEHGGDVEVLDVQRGVVRVRLTGACSGCTSAGETLRHRVEEALRKGLPGFVAMDVAADDGAAPHPPPAQVLLQIGPRPERAS